MFAWGSRCNSFHTCCLSTRCVPNYYHRGQALSLQSETDLHFIALFRNQALLNVSDEKLGKNEAMRFTPPHDTISYMNTAYLLPNKKMEDYFIMCGSLCGLQHPRWGGFSVLRGRGERLGLGLRVCAVSNWSIGKRGVRDGRGCAHSRSRRGRGLERRGTQQYKSLARCHFLQMIHIISSST